MADFRRPLFAWMFISLIGCGANNLTSPGTTTPNLAAPTGPNNSAATNTKPLKGTVSDALTGKALKATLTLVPSEEALPVATASAQATGSSVPSPKPTSSIRPSLEAKSDDKGHYEVKEAPDGTFSLLVTAPNYQAVSLAGVRSGNLDVALVPFKGPSEAPLEGLVKLTSQKPAAGIRVASSLLPGLTTGDAADCDPMGEFKMNVPCPPSGKVSIAAISSHDGEVGAFSYLPDVPLASERKDKKKPSHGLILRAVAHPIILAGESGAEKDENKDNKDVKDNKDKPFLPQRLQVFLSDANGEIPILTRSLRDSHFRVSLPELPEDASYHLVLSTKTEAGNASFLHFYKQTSSNLKLAASLLPNPSTAKFDGKAFSWEAVPEATFYRLRVEENKDAGRIIWEGFTNGNRIDLPELSLLDRKKDYRFSLTAIKLESGKEWTSSLNAPWAASSCQAPLDLIFAEEPAKNKH